MRSLPSQFARARGFTLIELLVVLAIVAVLLTLATPRYFQGIDRAKEVVLQENLSKLRTTLDQYYGDNGSYPDTLEQLVERRYLRDLPIDPITESSKTWVLIPPTGLPGKIYNVRSGAPGSTKAGLAYSAL